MVAWPLSSRITFCLFALLASASLGYVVGWSVGRSGPDPYVLAAVGPAVLGVFPAAALVLTRRVADLIKKSVLSVGITMCACAIVLAGALYGGILHGVEQRNTAVAELAQTEYETRIAQIKGLLLQCSLYEVTIKDKRKERNLGKLQYGYVCREFMKAMGPTGEW